MEATAGARERDSRAQAALRLEEYAATQHGCLTRAQANLAGVGDQMLRRLQLGGWLDRAEHGAYRMRGAHDLAWAGALAEALRRTLPKSRLKFADPLAQQFAEMVA